jgi:Protein of unknown function (DUF2924)
MSSPNHSVAEDRDNEPNSAPKLLLQSPEGDQAGASLDKLRGEWRRLYRCEPPRMSRDLLLRGIAYRRQELRHGMLGKTTRRKLKTLAKMFRTTVTDAYLKEAGAGAPKFTDDDLKVIGSPLDFVGINV